MRHAQPVRILASGVFVALLAASGVTAQQKFTDTSQVTVVEVPVQVVRDGQPVRGLKAEDFTVTQDRRPQAITGFDAIDLDLPQNRTLSADISAAGKRHFLLLFDFANSRPKTMLQARRAVMKSLVKTLSPSDLVAVATYSPVSGLRLLLGFTSDLFQVAAVLARMGTEKNDRPQAYDTGLAASEIGDALQSLGSSGAQLQQQLAALTKSPGAGLPSSDTQAQRLMALPLTEIAESFNQAMTAEVVQEASGVIQEQHNEIAEQKNLVAPLASSFTDLARMMSAVSGRKLVVLFSEGFDMGVVQGTEDLNGQEAMALATMSGAGALTVDNDARFGNTQVANLLEKMLEQFRRSDCVIESMDIAGLRGQSLDAEPQTSGEGALMQMSHDTGGDVFRNTNDLEEAFATMAKRTSVTYVLSFQPQGLKQDGAYHPIKVELKNAPRGTKVTFRSGYYAPRPWSQQQPMEKKFAVADQLMGSSQGGSIRTAVLAEPFRTAGAKAYVPVFVEAEGASLLGDAKAGALAAEVYVYAVDRNGIIRDYFNQGVQLDLTKAGTMLRQGGLKYYGHLELPPGDYSLRTLVRNGTTGAFGKRTTLVRVPEFGGAGEVLLPPLFPEVGGRWAVVHEMPRGEQKDVAYPFTVGAHAYVPASSPALQPGAEAAVALVGYHLGQEVRPEGKLEAADGRDLGVCAIQVRNRVAGGDAAPDVFQASFRPPVGLTPGDYRLVVTLDDGKGGPPQTVAAPFSVAAPAVPAAPAAAAVVQ